MSELTTIQIKKKTLSKIRNAKESPRQTYEELIDKAVTAFLAVKKQNTYDEFLHKIQQSKMKELWDNKEDEVWERA